jgi:hypothetical protein
VSIKWLTVQSYHQSHSLLAAINALSIHTKLELAKIPDEEGAQAAANAREQLSALFEQFEKIVGEAERDQGSLVLGVDPRLRQLARNFIKAKRGHRRFRSELFRNSLVNAKELLHSCDDEQKRSLIKSLADLRVLLEEHLAADADRILGDI